MNDNINSKATESLEKLGVINLRPQQEAPLGAILAGEDGSAKEEYSSLLCRPAAGKAYSSNSRLSWTPGGG